MAQYFFCGDGAGGPNPPSDDEEEWDNYEEPDDEESIDDIANGEVERFRSLTLPVMRALLDHINYSAEFYMQRLLKHFKGDATKKFSEQELKDEYSALFHEVISACRKEEKHIFSLQDILNPDPNEFDMNAVNHATEYLVWRLNGGDMLPFFAKLREDIRESLAATLGPAEQYAQSRLYEESDEREACTILSLAGPDRWKFYSKMKRVVSELCGWDAPKEKYRQGTYDTVMDYVIARIQV